MNETMQNEEEEEEEPPKNVLQFPTPTVLYQPVLLLVNTLVLCECGAPGTIVFGTVSSSASDALCETDAYCQHCFHETQR